MKASKAIKIVACICFILIAVALILIRNSPAIGYEASIYSATPTLVWVCLLFSIACGIGIIVHQIYSQEEHSHLWVIGLVLILLSNTVILSLHILRGYALWTGSGDPATHLGWIQDIIATGHYGEVGAFYPITHIYLAQLSQLGNLNPVIFFKWMPVLFALIGMVFMYFLAKSLLPDKRQVMLVTVAGTALIHGWYLSLTPNHLSNLLFPMAFYLLIKSFLPGTSQWKMLFLIIIFLMVPFHPVPAFALFLMLISLRLPRKALSWLSRKQPKIAADGFRFNLTISLLLSVWSILWISSFGVWDRMIRNLYTLATEGAPTHFTGLIGNVAYVQAYGFSITEYFFKEYGGILAFIILALVAFPILRKRIAVEGSLKQVTALYGPLAIIALAFIAVYFQSSAFTPRLLIYISLISVVFAGFTLSEFMGWATYHSNWLKKMVSFTVIVLLFAVSVNGILKVYPSPYIFASNRQTTQAEIQGVDWFFQNKGGTAEVTYWRTNLGRLSCFLLVPNEGEKFSLQRYVPNEEWKERPQHFGYGEHSMIGQSYGEDAYMVLGEQDRVLYTDVFPELAEVGVLPEDFIKLADDPSADKLYSNGGLDVWYIYQVD